MTPSAPREVTISPELRAHLGEAAVTLVLERAKKVRSVGEPITVRVSFVGECPLREGAHFGSGPARLQILAVYENRHRRSGTTELGIRINEHDAWPAWREGSFRNEVRTLSGRDDYVTRAIGAMGDVRHGRTFEDIFVVVVPSRRAAAPVANLATVAVAPYSLLRSVGALEVQLPFEGSNDVRLESALQAPDARLVKLRLIKTPVKP